MGVTKYLLAAGIAAGVTGSPAMAAPVVWTLSGVTFDDNSTASGSFAYDADTNSYSNYTITTLAGTAGTEVERSFGSNPGYVYTDFSAQVSEISDSGTLVLSSALAPVERRAALVAAPFAATLSMQFATALTGAGGTVNLTGNETYVYPVFERNASGFPFGGRQIVSGVVTTTGVAAVPEPASWAMMIGGFGMIGGAARYRRGRRSIAFA